MRAILMAAFGLAAVLAGPPPASAQAPAGPAVYVVTYFDVMPSASRQATGQLRRFAAATRKEDGNAELTVLHETGRSGRFAIIEAWRDKAAFEAHGAAMKALGDRLQPVFLAPFDARQFAPLSVAAPAPAIAANAVFVLTHVDVFPAGKDEVAVMVKTLVDDSRKDPGVQRFDAVVWDGHPNHFQLIAAWSARAAREAHQLADHTRTFRTKLQPFEGAFYDERLFEALK